MSKICQYALPMVGETDCCFECTVSHYRCSEIEAKYPECCESYLRAQLSDLRNDALQLEVENSNLREKIKSILERVAKNEYTCSRCGLKYRKRIEPWVCDNCKH